MIKEQEDFLIYRKVISLIFGGIEIHEEDVF